MSIPSAIGFDRLVDIDQRKFKLTAAGNEDSDGFDELQKITDIDGQTSETITKRIVDHVFFPRVDQFTNIPLVLERAMDMLEAAPDPTNAENFITIISDGLTNCTQDLHCANTQAGMLNSIAASSTVVNTRLIPNHVKLHFIMLGRANRPHTLLRKSNNNPNACMDDTEARDANPPAGFVDTLTGTGTIGNALRNLNDGSNIFVYGPNRFYDMTRLTGGLWFPIRAACPAPSNNVTACNNGSLTSVLNALCAASSSAVVGSSDYSDANGRLICDPKCRNQRTQVDQAIEEIVGRSPYVLVN